jgi:hypothetical protein
LNDAELRSSAVGDDEDDWATATVDDLIQQGRQRKEDAAREREELEQQRGELETLESFAVFGCFWSFFFGFKNL